ncbi:ComEA family DNA-binding protein [Campylobacter jejuni]|nr:ComEA family DNA-binding protein [Campylobacter jejuni]EJX7680872.1 ComEA family DNA-binding protein [Campylobacter jejuni]EJY2779321.1 ComEA family DNA-binding protein [Campylobacter jejuni]EKD6806623.1 ComEA family DNA-binding protein [Campylobacter jejuni]ELO6538711.1 ComEA family DNA-binding protein [Campylobacter jejuni]
MKKLLFLFFALTAFLFGAVNINTATLKELKSLNGIGEAKATKAILEYRKEANFTSIDDLKKVKGIGDKLFEKIKNDITVE